jgi:hypothetical protein
MGLCVDTSNETAWSVSADHLVVRYNAIESVRRPYILSAGSNSDAFAVDRD